MTTQTCAYCGGVADGSYTVHRDGFGVGPYASLCARCGSEQEPGLTDIWDRIAEPATGRFAHKRVDCPTGVTMDTDTNQFWLVWNPAGNNPSFRHVSEAAAMAEAERLADRHKGQRFYVLRATHRAQHVTVTVMTLHDPDVPF